MTTVQNIKLNSIKQLLDLNGEKVNFDLTFEVVSKDKVPFETLVVTQKMLDSDEPLEYKKITEGIIQGNIVSDKGLYDNYFLVLKSKDNAECQVKISIKDIPINKEFLQQQEMNNLLLKEEEQQQIRQQQIRQQQSQNLQPKTPNTLKASEPADSKKPSSINWKLILIVVLCLLGFGAWYYLTKIKPASLAKNIAPIQQIPIVPTVPQIELPPPALVQNNIEATLSATSETPISGLQNNLLSKINSIDIW
jgi:hypothetical protein